MDNKKKLLWLRTRVLKSSYTIKVPLPHALKNFINRVFIFVHCQPTNAMAITLVCNTSQSHDPSWIINSRWAWAAGIARTLLLYLCEQERSQQFSHFDRSVLNFNGFASRFAISMQCIFWTVINNSFTNYSQSVWFHAITTSYYILWQPPDSTLLIMQNVWAPLIHVKWEILSY